MTIWMRLLALIAAVLCGAIGTPVVAQPAAADCDRWERELRSGGERALGAVTYGWLPGCPGGRAPAGYAAAIRAARHAQDTAYLGRLASQASSVRDPAVFTAALEVADDAGASVRARIMALIVAGGHIGGSIDMPGWTRPELFTVTLPGEGVCGFGADTGPLAIDNGLPSDAPRRLARVIDDILYGQGGREQLRNLARCARSAVGEIPPQVDLSKVRVDYVCGTRFRVQNHTGVALRLDIAPEGATGAEETPPIRAPAIGGWTEFDVADERTLRVSYNEQLVATVQNEQKRCGRDR